MQEREKEALFAGWMKEYTPQVYAVARKMTGNHHDADDIVQNVFVKVWRNMDRFRNESKPGTWIYRISVNESLNYLNGKKRFSWLRFSDFGNSERPGVPEIADEQKADYSQLEALFEKAVQGLPEKQKAVFVLRFYEEKSYEEMEQIFGTSVGALKASYHHAVKKIEKMIGGD